MAISDMKTWTVHKMYSRRPVSFLWMITILPGLKEARSGHFGPTLGSRGYFFLIDTDGWRRSRVNEEKNNLWSQEYATSFPCEKSVQNLNWVTDWILPCPQRIDNIIMALIGYIEQLDMGVSNR